MFLGGGLTMILKLMITLCHSKKYSAPHTLAGYQIKKPKKDILLVLPDLLGARCTIDDPLDSAN